TWTARYDDGSSTLTSAPLEIEWTAGAVGSLELEVRDTSVTPEEWLKDSLTLQYGGTVAFRITAKDQHGNPVPNATISLNIIEGKDRKSTRLNSSHVKISY